MKYACLIIALLVSNSLYASVDFIWGMRSELGAYQLIGNKFKSEIESLTNKEVTVTLKLYSDELDKPFKTVSEDRIQIYQIPTSLLKTEMKDGKGHWLSVWEVPFVIKNKDHVESYIASQHTQENLKKIGSDNVLPLTYSYAGGFVAVLSKKGTNNIDLEKIPYCNLSEFEEKKVDSALEKKLYSALPCNILLYDIHIVNALDQKIKQKLKLDLNNNKVFARITLISKKKLNMIPAKYREKFLNRLSALLDEERQAIYKQAEENIASIKNDKFVEINFMTEQNRKLASQESIKKFPEGLKSKELLEEINFVQSLLK